MFRKNVGRVLIVAAGTGCLVVLFFVVLPMMDEPAPTTGQDEIVAQVLGPDGSQGGGEVLGAETPAPLVGIRNDGEEVAVVFPASQAPAAAEENPVDDSGLLRALSADDMAAAIAALEGLETEPGVPVEEVAAGKAEVIEAVPERAWGTEGPAGPDGSEGMAVVVPEPGAPVVSEVVPVGEGKTGDEDLPVAAALDAEVTTRAASTERANVEVEVVPDEGVPAVPADMQRVVLERPGARRVEFDVPLGSRASPEVSHPSGSPESGLPSRTGVIVPGTLRGVMGYRLPLVSRQEVPDQIVSGVLIPAHTTFVILKAGSWELVDVTPEELEMLREAAARREVAAAEVGPVRKGWNPLGIFRKRAAPVNQ